MMVNRYTNEKDILMLVALLKEHGITRAIVSPGSTNISLAASLLYDPDITVYSAVDERSAAYMACGLAEETGEPVLISCTGATASRNYVPALTEAFYRKLPVLAVTSSQHFGRVGQYFPQVTDRTNPMNDIVVKSVQIPVAHSAEDQWRNNVRINDALLELRRHGGGPVHINIETSFSRVFDVKTLPSPRVIRRIVPGGSFPRLKEGRIAIFAGAHSVFSKELTDAIDSFCEKSNAIVICDHTSNYQGKYRVDGGIIERQAGYFPSCRKPDLLIHIGGISGSYYKFEGMPVWRVSQDGEVRDPFRSLQYVFEMSELSFFRKYLRQIKQAPANTYYEEWKEESERLYAAMGELPFSNAWIARQTAEKIPENAVIHFGILNSLRMWNIFPLPKTVRGYANVGGFGIDGCISTLLGASLADKKKLYFGVVGDLAAFYDLNSLGNRHFGSNVRLMVVNNGRGFEMRHSSNRGDVFGQEADELFAAAGHFGDQSRTVLRDFARDLGFEYLSAENKEEYLEHLPHFTDPAVKERPVLFEVFVDVEDEYQSFELTQSVQRDTGSSIKKQIKNMIGDRGVQILKEIRDSAGQKKK